MALVSKNLGFVKAIYVGTTAPSNIQMIWYNTGDGLHYAYSLNTTSWVALRTTAESFLDLNDVDIASYAGQAGKAVIVNVTEDGLELGTASGGATDLAIANRTSTTLDITSSTGVDVTVPVSSATEAGLFSAANHVKLGYITITQAVDLDTVESTLSTVITNAGNLVTLSGVATNATSLGTFAGTTIADNSTIKAALQSLETFAESITGSTNLSVANITTTTLDILSSTGADATIPAATNSVAGLLTSANATKLSFISVTQAVDLDSIETSLGTAVTNISNLVTLSGVAANAVNFGSFTGSTLTDNLTAKALFQEIETSLESKLSGSGTTNYLSKYTAGLVLGNSLLFDNGTYLAYDTTTGTYTFNLNGDSARSFGMVRHTTSNTAGNNFSIYAGGATSGASDKNGGDLKLYSGISTGNGSSNFYVYTSSAGTSGTADRTQSLKFSITGTGVAKFENSLNANCFMQTGYNMVTLLGGATGYGIRISRPSDGSTSVWGGMMPMLSTNHLVFGGFNAGFYFVRNPQSDTVPSVVISGSSDNGGANIWAGVGTSGSYMYHYKRTFADSGSSTMSYFDHIGTCSSSTGPTTMTINNSVTNTFSNNIGLHLKTSGSTGKNIALYVESGQIGVGTNTPNASCLIDFVSTTMGIGVMNMTTAQKNAIASPKLGLTVFDTDLDRICTYESTGWQPLR